jgi:hypothetical protein
MMSNGSFDSANTAFFDRNQLKNLKTRAMRSGRWLLALQKICSLLFGSAIRVVRNISSCQIAESMIMVTKRVKLGMNGGFSRRLVEIVITLAQKASFVSQKLGNLRLNGVGQALKLKGAY